MQIHTNSAPGNGNACQAAATSTSTYAISNAAVSVLISFRLGLKMLLNYAVDFLGTKQNQIFLNTNFQ